MVDIRLSKVKSTADCQPQMIGWTLQAKPNEQRGPVEWVKEFVPGVASEELGFIKMFVNELNSAGLIAMKGDDRYVPNKWEWVTPFGDDLLRLISMPPEEKAK